MALQPVYLVATKNLSKFLNALRHAQAPEKVTVHFIEELGFTSTNDRLFIALLKAMRFLDEAGKPTSRYHAFLDDTEWKMVLADGMRDAYPDLFRVNRQANTLSREQLSGKIRSLGEGKISPALISNTAKTFIELAKIADFSGPAKGQTAAPASTESPVNQPTPLPIETANSETHEKPRESQASLVYRIEIVLPAVRDQAIYDAIFKSAKEHLFR